MIGTYTRRVWDEYWRKQEKRVWKAAFGLWRERNRTPEQTESPSARSAAEERAVHNRNQSVGLEAQLVFVSLIGTSVAEQRSSLRDYRPFSY